MKLFSLKVSSWPSILLLLLPTAMTGCVTPKFGVPSIEPQCLVLSICSIASAEMAVFNPDFLNPKQGPTKGPGHAIAQIAPQAIVKHGTSCAYMVLGSFSWGDSSIISAARDAHVEHIATVDYTIYSVLGFVYGEYCTRVSGV